MYILTDIFGGSVNNDLLTVQQEHRSFICTRMNLPLPYAYMVLVISIATQTGKIESNQYAWFLGKPTRNDWLQTAINNKINIGGRFAS